MPSVKCDVCGAQMMKNGFTRAGRQRWRCGHCGASRVCRLDTSARALALFVNWILDKASQKELGMPARTFRSKTSRFWELWPILPACDEIHRAVYMDGIWLARGCVVLIACTDAHVIGCHLARSENSRDWGYLMQRIAAPDMLVCDGGGGIAKAMRAIWPKTKMQRCLFHVFCQVRRYTTTRPKTQAGVELYGLAKELMHLDDAAAAAQWMARFQRWCTRHEQFLRERSETDRRRFKHERLRKARRSLIALCRSNTLFTYLDEEIGHGQALPRTSNRIENVNGRIRRMLSFHRGMNIDHRIKAVFWFCYMQSEAPVGFAEMLKTFPRDEDIRRWQLNAAQRRQEDGAAPALWGQGVAWEELHSASPYPFGAE